MARDFDGTGDFVNFGDINALDGLTTLSVSAWVLYDVMVDYATWVSKLSAAGTDGFTMASGAVGHGNNDDILCTVRNANVKGGHTTGLGWSTGTWHHVVMLYDGGGATDADKLKIWADGASQTVTFSLPTLSTTIGANAGGVCIGSADLATEIALNGKGQEIACWSRILTSAEIGALANRASPMLMATSLLLYGPIEGVASPEPDLSVTAASGTVNGTSSAFAHNTIYRFQRNDVSTVELSPVSIGSGFGGVLIE